MPLIWTPVHSIANWTTPPTQPRVARAAITGQGWLVATEVAGGWSTTFVPDPTAINPSDETVTSDFQTAKVDWDPSAATPHGGPNQSSEKGEEHGKSKKGRNS